MNSAVNYLSAAQLHSDALREARRNPRLPKPERTVAPRRHRPRPPFRLLAYALGRY